MNHIDEKIKNQIREIALQNAFAHKGKTQDGIVLSKILGINPELKNNVKNIMTEISDIVVQINNLTQEQQKSEIKPKFSQTYKKTSKKQILPELEGAIKGKVITRFPPEPNGYPHIGHAKAAIINEEYVNIYGGKKILRLDDTNPENERLEYYAAIKVGLEWLGIKYDIIKNTSDDMELLLQKGKEIISSNNAYICTCKRDNIKKNRQKMIACKCSNEDPEKNSGKWEKMFEKYKPGDAIVRFRGSMNSKNTVMRDPVLFRIIDEKHPLLGDKYRVWPSYDFAVAIEDSIDGITHAFRSKEYELRNELYYSILDKLNMRKPRMSEFSRLEFDGMPVSKRLVKSLIENGNISWYDDPRLLTLEGLKRRGISPKAIRDFIASLGFTKADTRAPFDTLESFNRKIIDADSIRLFLVENPKKISIKNLPVSFVMMPNHPTKNMGKRKIEFGTDIYVPSMDVDNINKKDHIRLMGLGNISIENIGAELVGSYVGDDINTDYKKIQWVPHNAHRLTILIPKKLFVNESFNEQSLSKVTTLVEPYYLTIKESSLIQFVRFGYCHKESQNMAIYTHK